MPTGFRFAFSDMTGSAVFAGSKNGFGFSPLAVFNVTVQSFNNTTGVVIGTFSGNVYTVNGDIVQLTDGQFKAMLH